MNKIIKNKKGFTIIEILVALAISSFFLAALTSFFISTNKMNTVQDQVSVIQNDIRAAMEMISYDIRMCGLDGVSDPFDIDSDDEQNTDSNSINISYDSINNVYFFDKSKGVLLRNGENLTKENVIDSIIFEYYYYKSGELTKLETSDFNDPSDSDDQDMLNDIKQVRIKICGKITGAYEDDFKNNEYCFTNIIPALNN